MNETPQLPTADARRLYTQPRLAPLGSVEAVTAGDHSGSLDQLVGGTGGFMEDGTS